MIFASDGRPEKLTFVARILEARPGNRKPRATDLTIQKCVMESE